MPIPPEAQQAAERGDVIGAIRITRETASLGLREAKEAVDAYLQGRRSGAPKPDGKLPPGAMASLQEGDLIQAIRHTREATGQGLKDSKQMVERHLAANPLLREQFLAARQRHRGGWKRMLLPLTLLAIVVLMLLKALA